MECPDRSRLGAIKVSLAEAIMRIECQHHAESAVAHHRRGGNIPMLKSTSHQHGSIPGYITVLVLLDLKHPFGESRFQAGSVSATSQVPLSKNAFFSSSMAAIHCDAWGDSMAAVYDTGCWNAVWKAMSNVSSTQGGVSVYEVWNAQRVSIIVNSVSGLRGNSPVCGSVCVAVWGEEGVEGGDV